ncbi:hypothetical protein H1C71_030980 [Ictidomys tridecemlineatus]|uniref:uncharacterized protein LOC120889540 n=1 Tax=Ictidomys tridecemlineatus TaxID=43179 RepID=UPI001A9FB75D|nr:uncharacterized protein LOC120889540 [Ictidomys tridecemlineatus]XP_040140128.1 uncharacterized protein LOC120889540 [Ictidomys tridecemlineatus]KAG3272734.1 hypothetical protein H1C71_030980 [Ictidomys tridecemlineatus]
MRRNMNKDFSARMEALITQASDIDPATTAAGALTGVVPPVKTLLEDAPLTASHGVNVGQKSVGQKDNDEMKKVCDFSLYLSAEADGPCPDLALVHAALEEDSCAADGEDNVGKKTSRKRRNKKESKIVYLPLPLTLQTRASSAAQFLSQSCAMESFPIANVGQASNEQRWDETSVLAQPWEALNGAVPPETSPGQSSLEEASVTTNEENKVQQKSKSKGKNKKNEKIAGGPWPLTVQAWVSFTGPNPAQTSITRPSPIVNDAISIGPKSRGQRCEDSMSILTLSQDTDGGDSSSFVALGRASLEELSSAPNSEANVGKKRKRKRRHRKRKNALAHLWPLTVQAWASFTEANPAQTLLQGKPLGRESWPQLEKCEEERKSVIPWSEGTQTGPPCSIMASLQTSFEGASLLEDIQTKLKELRRRPVKRDEGQLQNSIELTLESCQGWRNAERYPRDQNFWECTVMNFARQVDCCYCGELCSQERMEALTLTKAHTHISTSVMGMHGPEKEGAESQTIWMGKWESF